MDNKIIELEEKFAHLDHLLDSLNNVVFRQAQKIDELEEMIKHLSAKIEQLKDNALEAKPENNPPPHY